MDPVRPSHAMTPEQFGPYEVYDRIGMGGMASVHRAKKRGPAGFERTVALKRMLSHLTEDRSFVDSFVREAKVASMLAHPNIAQVYDFGRINGVFYIAMEMVGGYDVRKLLRHAHKSNEPIPLPVVLSILCELCEALDYAHSFVDEAGNHLNIVHRDISPSNMIVSPMGHVKVIDFGIAKANGRHLHTDTGSVKGKLGYMAPEVALGMAVGPAADIFSAGVVAWELVTALPLFSGRTDFDTMRKLREDHVTPPSRHNPTCPALLDQVISAALAREPENRLATARAFRTVLDQVAQQQGIQVNARAVGEWMRAFGPGDNARVSAAVAAPTGTASGRMLPLPAGPETRVTSPSRPNRITRSPMGPQLRRSEEDIALATEIWGEDGHTAAPVDSGQDFSLSLGAGSQPLVNSYAQSLPGTPMAGTPMAAQIPSLANSQRVSVIAPSQAGFAVQTGVTPMVAPPARTKRSMPLILAGLAIVAGVLGGVLYAKRTVPSEAAAPATAEVKFVVDPAGSVVEVAGKDLGAISETELPAGVYSITVKHDGYKPWTTSITLREGDKQTINVALTGEVVAVAPLPTPPPSDVAGSATAPVAEDPPVVEPDPTPDKVPSKQRPDHRNDRKPRPQPQVAVTPPVEKDPEPAKVEPPKVDPEPPKVDPPKVDPPKVVPPVVPEKPKTTPVVAASAVTKISGEVPQLRGKGADSSDVLAKMCIDERGTVASVKIVKSPPEIASDLQRALMSWRYKPYTNRDNKLSPVCFPLSIRVILKQ